MRTMGIRRRVGGWARLCAGAAVIACVAALPSAARAQVVSGVSAESLVSRAVASPPTAGAAQTPGAAQAAGEADPGVRPVRLIDRDEIRVSRVELQPGAVRRVHAHDDVEYHVWTPVAGALEITIGQGAPQAAAPGQAFFMKRGTLHGFRNTGQTPAAVFEIFVKRSTVAAATAPSEDVVAVLAALGVSPDLVTTR